MKSFLLVFCAVNDYKHTIAGDHCVRAYLSPLQSEQPPVMVFVLVYKEPGWPSQYNGSDVAEKELECPNIHVGNTTNNYGKALMLGQMSR